MSQHTARLPYHQLSSKAFMGLVNVSEAVKKGALGARLAELVFLRVSQINGCAYCMDMHWNYLVKDGMEPRHLNAVAGWREAPFFSEHVARALEGLPPDFRAVVILSDIEEFSYKEIAEIMGCPIGTVMSRLHRARRALCAKTALISAYPRLSRGT